MSAELEDKDELRENILRRIHDGQEVGFEELASAMFTTEHICAISRRNHVGLYGKQCGRDVSDLLQQNLLLSQAVRMVNEYLQKNQEAQAEPVEPAQPEPAQPEPAQPEPALPEPPPRSRWLSWLRKA